MLELETLFSMVSTVAAFSWLALAVTPLTWSWPARLGRAAALGLSLLYVALIVSFWSGGEGGFDSLASVASLFETRGLLRPDGCTISRSTFSLVFGSVASPCASASAGGF